ncbi:conserved membrane protein of unknown function [Streptomyces ambofaciens ATCC 23877]|uniref:Uncharacterized protein n=1 Tax=Streptomyces ambofaciens (strain ATCC 23877 / 3486 / DSM 40053 / JCM 4204 / NBRC 12836 / NRRL B-2516) TaxID=278992 RepID=A0A0K2B0T3_STRA7|nr:hypothetical protein [Streptomyces ambofaciens]AKZ58884.1 conserved membrane protein of unknown function [Streptomyces ambofaciens ATCC 23877]
MAVSTPVDAEQAWKDLQRIRVPQERVYDEVERSASGGGGTTYATAAIMWVFLAVQGLDLPLWGVLLTIAAYVGLLGRLAVVHHRRSRMRLHHSRVDWRTLATFVAGAVVTGATVLLSGRMVESLEPVSGGLIRATVSAAVFVLFIGPAGRWAAGSLRDRGVREPHPGAGR